MDFITKAYSDMIWRKKIAVPFASTAVMFYLSIFDTE